MRTDAEIRAMAEQAGFPSWASEGWWKQTIPRLRKMLEIDREESVKACLAIAEDAASGKNSNGS